MMNLLSCALLAALSFIAHGSAVKKVSVTSRMAPDLEELKERVKGCNANVCFAIDGSGSISSKGFKNEKNFVLDIVSVIVDNPVEVGAVQFSSSVRTISPLTPDDFTFNVAVERATQLGGLSFVTGGMNACFSQLSRRKGEPLKIVLLTDGRSNIGSSAIRRADEFRASLDGTVFTVAAGDADDEELLGIAGGDPSKVFALGSFDEVLALERFIESLVVGICEK